MFWFLVVLNLGSQMCYGTYIYIKPLAYLRHVKTHTEVTSKGHAKILGKIKLRIVKSDGRGAPLLGGSSSPDLGTHGDMMKVTEFDKTIMKVPTTSHASLLLKTFSCPLLHFLFPITHWDRENRVSPPTFSRWGFMLCPSDVCKTPETRNLAWTPHEIGLESFPMIISSFQSVFHQILASCDAIG